MTVKDFSEKVGKIKKMNELYVMVYFFIKNEKVQKMPDYAN